MVLGHGAWSWCMVHGAWCMVRSAWCMVRSAWCLVMVLGAWCVTQPAETALKNAAMDYLTLSYVCRLLVKTI
jgi:hypothetical protein